VYKMANTAAKTALAGMLANGSDWDVEKTSVPGIYIQKMPESENGKIPEALCVVVNPPNDKGNPSKRRGLYVRTAEDVAFYKAAFSNEKMLLALGLVAEVNGTPEAEEAKEEIVISI